MRRRSIQLIQCSEPRPQTAPAKAWSAKATGGRQDYHDFEVPLLTMLLVLASQALTVRRKQSSFSTENIPILGAGAADAAGAVFRDTASCVPSSRRILV